MSPLLQFAENRLQVIALLFMAAVYAAKIAWIFTFPAPRDRQPRTGRPDTNPGLAARYSLAAIAMPWTMSSTRTHPLLWVQFAIFHLGVAASITMSFLIPYAPGTIDSRGAVLALQAIFSLAFLAGAARLVRRLADPYMRAISSPDDYFSMALLLVWLFASVLAAPNRQPGPVTGLGAQGETALLAYFFLTAFFLVYVPFSKISHYLYYPFARWYLGRTLGHRGVLPIKQVPGSKFQVSG
jgi:nitrate reductase gamma subunit